MTRRWRASWRNVSASRASTCARGCFATTRWAKTGSHLIGYIGRINQAEKKVIDEWDDDRQANYKGTEYIGKLGLEQAYEDDLHGVTGYEEVETSAGGRAVRRLDSHGATPGNTLRLSVDIKLQALVEEMFGERRGALVAIDPRSGEVLALVSKPTFDPNLFVDGIDADNWRDLNESIDKPLLNRALRGTYPPGSSFKPFMAMAALNTGKRSPNTVINDTGSYQFGNHLFRSHGDKGLGPVDMTRSIVKSSNVYFYSLANDLGVDLMYEQLSPFGFGRKTGIDIDGELTGLLPSTEWKRKAYKRPEMQKWYAGETISLGIGQGYNNFTALQLAYATATLASGGQRFKPRLVREIEDVVTRERKRVAFDAVEPLPFKREHVELVLRAMYGVTQEGTSVRSFVGAPYKTGGKTGTAQAVSIKANEKYNAAKLEEHQRDHSIYIAFAPLEAPIVALGVIVENAGFGSDAAAPIARRVFDYLLLGQVPSIEDMALTQAGQGHHAGGQAASGRGLRAAWGRRGSARRTARRQGAAMSAAGRSEGARSPSGGQPAGQGGSMSAVFDQPTLWQRVRPMFGGFDAMLAVVAALLAAAGLITMYSAGFDHGTRFVDHARNMALAFGLMFIVAQIPPQKLMGLAVPLYVLGVALLVATAVFGITKKGATRWLNVGVVIQPSEILKIAMPIDARLVVSKARRAAALARLRDRRACCCWCRWGWWSSSPISAPRS